MPGRHAAASQPRRSRGLLVLVVVLALLIPIAAFVVVRELRIATIGHPDPCSGTLRVHLAAPPEIAGPLKRIAMRVENDRVPVDGACVTYSVTPAASRDVYARLSGDSATKTPDLWIPDTWEWVARTGIPKDRLLSLSPSVATSPLVLATSQTQADDLQDDAGSWATLATAGRMALGDAEESGVALSALLALRRSFTDEPATARTNLGTSILALTKERVDDLDVELDRATGYGLIRGVPATEQQVLNVRRQNPKADIVPVVPAGGTVHLDYPLVAVLHEKRNGARLIEAGATLMRYADARSGRAEFRKAGFRDYRDQAPPPDADAAGEVTVLPPSTLDDADEVLRSWAAMSLESRLLTVVDVSHSMVVEAGERTRIELARDAAKTAFTYLPNTAAVGLWQFSENRDGARPYLQLSPTEPLTPQHRADLNADLDALPGQTGGSGALYDTVLAAYRTVQAGYDPTRVNSLVLLTDACPGASAETEACRNEAATGMTITQLLSTLDAEADPDRPVALTLVGIGAQADLAALDQIAEVTNGRAHRAKNAGEVEGIIIDLLLRRQCGPACG
ncbi:substrate-binding domain-containing protein [Actinopolymorpha sp. B17G11]|uniref:substrate-binding domain-containing protein n=1 Tax=Actinopolymorpha sp. B17G11 TaxID=3160861 RepID=UPI0032E38C33